MVKETVMKRYKSILLVLFSILGCQSEIEQEINTNENAIPMTFYAGIEIPKDSILTKTVLDGSPSDAFRNVLWEYQDEVYVTNGSQLSKFINTSEGMSEIALLEGELAEGTNYFAAYPYGIVTRSSSSSFTVDLPSEQTYCPDGIESGAFPMVAQCEEGVFNFKNLCGILVLQLLGEQAITSITFSGKDVDGNYLPIAGTGIISMDYTDVPTLVMDKSSKTSVSLLSSEGVVLNPNTPTSFHIVLPSGKYSSFELIIQSKDGGVMTVKSNKPLNIKRSSRLTTAVLSYIGQVINLNKMGQTANSYIISEPGAYKFKAVKGNRNESVGSIANVDVLWESIGTKEIPNIGDLIKTVSHTDEYIIFNTNSQFHEGNAVIAARNSDGKILWSWHIWLTDQPKEQQYYNDAGIMMDRNLGALSAQPGVIGSNGLLYQWGRKDPFIRDNFYNTWGVEHSTGIWTPSVDNGSIDFTIKNPMSWVGTSYDYYHDFHYSMYYSDNTLWGSQKTIYDPCPAGWRVPDGGENGIWSVALGSNADMTDNSIYDSTNMGFDFSYKLGDEIIWYPAAGNITNGNLSYMEETGEYWSVSTHARYSKSLHVTEQGRIYPCSNSVRYSAKSVRCQKESSNGNLANVIDLNQNQDTANSYIISDSGNYKFRAVKGNGLELVGAISNVEVLWESFGTNISPKKGDLINTVTYVNEYIQFSTPEEYKEGNALIAALDANQEVLWSWHIWLTDKPEEQYSNNGSDIVMDRNLGATSATRGDAASNGLLYQWGRKDPFLGSSDTRTSERAKSTGEWKLIQSSLEVGTILYATTNPLTFIYGNYNNFDWYYSESATTDFTRWTGSKTIYDPCPPGWMVPPGDDSGLWQTEEIYTDIQNLCIGLSIDNGYAWYPCSGSYSARSGELVNTGKCGTTWSSTPSKLWGYGIYGFYFNINGTCYGETMDMDMLQTVTPLGVLKSKKSCRKS